MAKKEYEFRTIPKYRFSDCQLLNSESNEVSDISEGETFTIAINQLNSFSPENVDFTLVACLFKDGVMEDINFKSVTVNANSVYPGSVKVQMDVPDDIPNVSDGQYQLKVFRINSFENLQLYYDDAVIYSEK